MLALRSFVVLALLVSSVSHGAPPKPETPKVNQKEIARLTREAEKLAGKKAWSAAIAVYQKAYGLSQHPILWWNIARCYEESADLTRALSVFKSLPDLAGVDKEMKAKAAKKVAEIEALLKLRSVRPSPGAPGAPTPEIATPASTIARAFSMRSAAQRAVAAGKLTEAISQFRGCLDAAPAMHDCRAGLIALLLAEDRCLGYREIRTYLAMHPGGPKRHEYRRLADILGPQCRE